MPTITNTTAVLTATLVNLVAGSQYEYLPNDANVEIGLLGDVTGGLVTIISGSDLLAQEGAMPFLAGLGNYPKYPDDFHWSDEAAAGDRLTVQVRNPTGGTINVRWVIKLTWM
jgi:hypothetical protein